MPRLKRRSVATGDVRVSYGKRKSSHRRRIGGIQRGPPNLRKQKRTSNCHHHHLRSKKKMSYLMVAKLILASAALRVERGQPVRCVHVICLVSISTWLTHICIAAEQPSSQDPADALEQIARIVQDIHQRSVHAGSATTRDKNQKGRPPADQEDSMQVLTRIAAIVQNTPQGPAQYNKSGNAAKDIDNIRASATAAVEHASGGARRGSVTLAIIRGLDAVNRIINPQQSEQGSEHPAASATSVEGSPSHTEELHREPEPRLAPTRKELKKAEKKEAKKHREVRKVEKDRIKTENKDAKKANKAKKKEEKGRARKEKKGKRLAATDNYLPRLPTTTAWAAAARTDSPVPVPTPDGPAGSSRPLGGGDGAESLFGGPPSSGTCSSGSAVPCRSTCSSANAPWALSACRCR